MPNKSAPVTMDAVYTKPGYLFRRMQQIAVAIFVEECKAYDLTPVQYASLVAIRTHPGIDATRLSAVIAFDRSTLGSVIERLEAKDYIERKPAREDKRVKLLHLTRQGVALLRAIMPSVARPQRVSCLRLSRRRRGRAEHGGLYRSAAADGCAHRRRDYPCRSARRIPLALRQPLRGGPSWRSARRISQGLRGSRPDRAAGQQRSFGV